MEMYTETNEDHYGCQQSTSCCAAFEADNTDGQDTVLDDSDTAIDDDDDEQDFREEGE